MCVCVRARARVCACAHSLMHLVVSVRVHACVLMLVCMRACVCVFASVFECVRDIHKDKDVYGCCICHLSLSLKTCPVYVCT